MICSVIPSHVDGACFVCYQFPIAVGQDCWHHINRNAAFSGMSILEVQPCAYFRTATLYYTQALGIEVAPNVPCADPKPASFIFMQNNFPRHIGCFWKNIGEVDGVIISFEHHIARP